MFGFNFFKLPYADPIVDLEGPQQPKDKGLEPESNEGRDVCWWCDEKIETKLLFTSSYQECPKCLK